MVTMFAVCALGLTPVVPGESWTYETTQEIRVKLGRTVGTHRDFRDLTPLCQVFISDEVQDAVRERLGNDAIVFEHRKALTVTVRARGHREGARITQTYMDVFFEELERQGIRPRMRLEVGEPVTRHARSKKS